METKTLLSAANFKPLFRHSHHVNSLIFFHLSLFDTGVTRKEAQKRFQDTENLFRKNLQLKDVS